MPLRHPRLPRRRDPPTTQPPPSSTPDFKDSYRLCVVCVAGDERAVAVFSWSAETARWISETGAAALKVKPITAARLEVVTDE
jgi:hypothetical protein